MSKDKKDKKGKKPMVREWYDQPVVSTSPGSCWCEQRLLPVRFGPKTVWVCNQHKDVPVSHRERARVAKAEAAGTIVDSMAIRQAIMVRWLAGEVTLEDAQASLRKVKKTGREPK